MKKIGIGIIIILYTMSIPAFAWWNGPFPSKDINNPGYGTHDMIFDKAVDILPADMRDIINMKIAFYGTEIPDCQNNTYCINDQYKHHVFFYKNGTLKDTRGAVRAQQEYDLAKFYLKERDNLNFSLHLGAMSHYIADLAVYTHTLGNGTDWGPDIFSQHYDYERYVDNNLTIFSNITFDGTYDNISAYDAAIRMANETTFNSGIYTNVWMQKNYNWSDPRFVQRTKDQINLSTNIIADVIYKMLYTDKTPPTTYIYGVTEGGYYDNNATIILNATDFNGSGIDKTMFVINGGNVKTYLNPLIIDNEGKNNITYWSIDKVGNVEKHNIVNFSINETLIPTPIPTPNVTATTVMTPNITNPTPNVTTVMTPNVGSGRSGGSSGSSNGGSGGGGLPSAELYSNILKFEYQENFISAKNTTAFKYLTPELSIYEVDILGAQSEDVILRVELLKNTSKLANISAPGLVYKNINMWINSKRIQNNIIKFKVENSWIDRNGIDETNILLLKWEEGKWKPLETTLQLKDALNTYFESNSTNLTIFAISSIEENLQNNRSSSPPNINNNVGDINGSENPVTTLASKKSPGFEFIVAVLLFSITYILKKNYKNK